MLLFRQREDILLALVFVQGASHVRDSHHHVGVLSEKTLDVFPEVVCTMETVTN